MSEARDEFMIALEIDSSQQSATRMGEGQPVAEKALNEKALKKKGLSGISWLVLASLIWGTVGVSSALINRVESTPPMMIAFMRMAFSAPFLLSLTWLTTGRNPFRLNRREWFYYSVMGLAMAFYQVTYFFAIPMAGVTLVVVTALCSSPILVAFLSIPIFKERLTGGLLLALALALSGTALLAFGGGQGAEIKSGVLLGAGLALLTGLAYSVLAIFSRIAMLHGTKGEQRGPIQPTAVAFSLSALVLLPVTLATGSFRLEMAAGVWLIGLYMGIMPTGVAYIIFMKGITSASATAATITTMLEPAVAAILAWLLLGERLTLASLCGTLLLLGSVLILNKRK
ncbi:MAG TPA: EamA family transporter [Chloroflexia bacterium]|nr:EamA family transporter [Chloroflexia bacterium]